MNYNVDQIAQITNGQITGIKPELVIQNICFDTRTIRSPKNSLFLALKTENDNGHKYISEAINQGIQLIICEIENKEANTTSCQIIVKNSLVALQKLAAYHRAQFDLPVIGITGSYGKTIVKEWLHSLLNKKYAVVKSPRSYNSQLGTAISVLNIAKDHNLGIFEAGISKTNEMESLQNMIQPNIGLITNIGAAHDLGFESKKLKLEEKLKLFAGCEKLIFCQEDELIFNLINSNLPQVKKCSWGFGQSCKYRITKNSNGSQNTVKVNDLVFDLGDRFNSDFEFQNLIHSVVLSLELGVDPSHINQRIDQLSGLSLRLELKDGVNENTLIDDSYVFDLDSLKIALDFVNMHGQGKEKVLILTDLEDQKNDKTLYKSLATIINEEKINKLIGVGNKISWTAPFLDNNISSSFYKSTAELANNIENENLSRKAILIKGARKFKLEHISQLLCKKNHQAYLEVNLEALDQNLNYFKSKLSKAGIIAVIKADAYGTGSIKIAHYLKDKVRYFAVAYIDEGVELRQSGILNPILVLNPESEGFSKLSEYDLEPEIYSLRQLRQFINALKDPLQKAKIHIKINTGMNRLGFNKTDLKSLIQIISTTNIEVKSIFSHLAASDDHQEKSFSQDQIERFESAYQTLSSGLGYSPQRHLLNSAGILNFPDHQYELVRLGIGMYGLSLDDKNLKPVHRLKASISQINHLGRGDSIGYGHQTITDQNKTIATINIGYADGVMRILGNGKTNFVVKGQVVPTIGNICMDMLMLDISDTKGLKEGMEVEIFGDQIALENHAKAAKTISYELLSRLSSRIKKIYIKE